MAVLLVLGPVFDEDMFPWEYGFREGMDAKMALRRIHFGIADRGAREVVDADLSDYFNAIPYTDLLRCVARRVADGTVLAMIRQWLDAPVIERADGGGGIRTAVAHDTNRGTPQGGVISPLLSNLYFRRFMLAWYHGGHARRLQAEVVNYADDFVILCREGMGDEAMATMRRLMSKLGLTVNEKKTRLVKLPEERFDFLGYTVGWFYGYRGRPYWGTAPSMKSIKRLRELVHNVIESGVWGSGEKALLSFYEEDAMYRLADPGDRQVVGYVYLPVAANAYRKMLIDTYESEGGSAPRIEAVLFGNDKRGANRVLGIIVSWSVAHADTSGTLYATYIYGPPKSDSGELEFLEDVSKKFGIECECVRSDGQSHAKYKSAAAVKAALKKFGL